MSSSTRRAPLPTNQVVTRNRNPRSHQIGNPGHANPESAVTSRRNTQ